MTREELERMRSEYHSGQAILSRDIRDAIQTVEHVLEIIRSRQAESERFGERPFTRSEEFAIQSELSELLSRLGRS